MWTRTPTKVAALLFSVMLLGAAALIAQADIRVPAPAKARPAATVVVRSGDTLWSIAVRHVQAGQDVRKLVYEIRKANGLDTATLQPGQVLTIPL